MRKKIEMRKVLPFILLMSLLFSSNLYAQIYEYPFIYKDPRIMGMGGANIAVGGYATSIFFNPASISLNKKNKYIVDMLRFNLSFDKNGIKFFNDIQDAVSVGDINDNSILEDDRLKEVIKVLDKYKGQDMHAGWDAIVAISRTGSDVAFSFGLLVSTRYTAKVYKYSHTEGIVNIYFDNYIAPFGGLSFNFFQKRLTFAFSWKYMFRRSTKDNISAREIAYKGHEIDSYIIDDLGDEGRAHIFDFGMLYKIPFLAVLKPTFGLSVLNIGNPELGDLGKFPQTINIGFGLNPVIRGFKGLKIGFDFIDVMKNIDYDESIGKRLRYGFELKLIDNIAMGLSLRAGVYQSYFTGGFEFRLAVIDVIFTTYAEELGVYAGQDEDRRYVLSAGISW